MIGFNFQFRFVEEKLYILFSVSYWGQLSLKVRVIKGWKFFKILILKKLQPYDPDPHCVLLIGFIHIARSLMYFYFLDKYSG